METNTNKTFNEKVKDAQSKMKAKFMAAKVSTRLWYEDNKETLKVYGPIILGAAVEIVKIVAKNTGRQEEKDLKELYIYDRRKGHYYQLRRKLKNSEYLEIDRRVDNGESLGDVLRDMRVLK